jgi:hypothetical protein
VKKIPLIHHKTWNSLIDKINRRRPLRFQKLKTSKKWEHPWTITPSWDELEGKWLFRIKPGFVNGSAVTIPTRVKYAGDRTVARLKKEKGYVDKPEAMIDAFLTEWPRVEVGPTRLIGTGANPSGISSDNNIKLSYEPVPEFFSNLGVTSANTQIEGSINSGITFIDGQEDAKTARRLRACDVSLWKDRPSAKFEIYPGSVLDGSLGSIYITYNHSGRMNKNAYLRVESKYVAPIVPESEMALIEGITDPEYDFIKIATIYFVSEEGAEIGAELDRTWTPHVQYNTFWNLAHAPRSIPESVPIEPIRLTTALAGGLADITIAMLLSPLNSQLNQAIQILKSRNMKGSFWSL